MVVQPQQSDIESSAEKLSKEFESAGTGADASDSQQTVQLKTSQRKRKLCCVLIPVATIFMMGLSALIAYVVLTKPGSISLD